MEKVAKITKSRRTDGSVIRAKYNWEVREGDEIVAFGGPVTLGVARHNCLTLGARLGAYYVAQE